MQRLIPFTAILILASSCTADTGLDLAPNWQTSVISKWQDAKPDMLVLSDDGKTLFVSCETTADMLSPSLARIDLESHERQIVLYGLNRGDGLKMDHDGDLWIGEEVEDGRIYKIISPERIPAEQRVDRTRLVSSHPDIAPILSAGRFSHEGLAFSLDGKYLYLADEWKEGCLYRYTLMTGLLEVFHSSEGWLKINTPDDSRFKAEVLHGKYFNRLEDLETLPDGRILLAETGSKGDHGRIWILDDRKETPKIEHYFEHSDLIHPDNLEWDHHRNLLWITADHSPSVLWRWDGKTLMQVASHAYGEITGVESSSDGSVYFNLQHNTFGPDLTLRITPATDN